MRDLIDKDKAIEVAARRYRIAYKRWMEYGDYGNYCGSVAFRRVALELDKLPAVQREIIRCKDCKHRPIAHRADEGVFYGFSLEFPDDKCPFECDDGWYNQYPEDDFYCANAERKDDK